MEDPDTAQPKTLVVGRDESEGFNPNKTTHIRNLVAFWFLGLCNNYGYVIMLSFAHDILHEYTDEKFDRGKRDCNFISTGAILLADIVPCLLIKIICSWFLPCYLHINMILACLLSAVSYVLVACSAAYWQAVMGVVFVALSSGIGEVTMLSYMALYDKNVVSTFASGTGGAGFFGSLSYALFTQVMKPRTAVLSMTVVAVLEVFMFWGLLVHPIKFNLFFNLDKEAASKNVVQPTIMENKSKCGNLVETFHQKSKAVPSLFKYMWPIFLIYLFEYMINQGYFELAYFNVCWLSRPEQYRWLQVDYQTGVFISRSSVNFLPFPKVWLLAIFQAANFTIFTIDAYEFIIPRFGVMLVLVFLEGLIGGAGYVNTFYRIKKEVPAENRVFALGFVSIADACGISLSGILAIYLHNAVCNVPYGRNDQTCTKI